jgi:hypothetical protein
MGSTSASDLRALLSSVTASARWISRQCSRGALGPLVVVITGAAILLSPWLTPYSFGRDWLTRLEVVLASLQLAGIVLLAAHRVAMENLADGAAAILLARPLSRLHFAAASVLGCSMHVLRLLAFLGVISLLPGLVSPGLPAEGESPGARELFSAWSGSLGISFCLISIQVVVLAAMSHLVSFFVPASILPVLSLIVFLLIHAATGTPSGGGDSGGAVAAGGQALLKFLPRFADLTPYNLMDESGRLPVSSIAFAVLHGASLVTAFIAISAILARRRDL